MNDNDEIKEPAISGEQQSALMELDRLAGEGAPENPAAPGQVEQAQRPPLDKELAGLLMVISKMLAPMFPTVAAIYTEQTCEEVGAVVAPVCDKHGWLQGGVGGKWGEEIMAAAIVVPLALTTITAAKADIAARKNKKPEPEMVTMRDDIGEWKEPVAASDDAGKTVRFG